MNATINIKLKPSNRKHLEQKTKDLNINSEELINKALDDYFYFERLKEMRKELKNVAKENGFEDEETILNSFS